MPAKTILDLIGNTPLLELKKFSPTVSAHIYAKLELFNPGGSVKDRLGKWLVADAEKHGLLQPGGTIVEATSGNTGIGLALAATIKGYKCIFVIPDKMSCEKITIMKAYGAKVIVTPTNVPPNDPKSCYSIAQQLAHKIPGAWLANQYNNPANSLCHYHTTGPEILQQLPAVDILVAGVGTGGTLSGVGRYLKGKKPQTTLIAVDPVGSIIYDYFKTKRTSAPQPYCIEGIGEDFIPNNLDLNNIDDIVQVSDDEAFAAMKQLVQTEGIFAGTSSGAALAGAIKWIQKNETVSRGKNVVVILPDRGERYLSKMI